MTLYNMRSADGDYRVTKFDDDLNVVSSYLVSEEACTCPAGVRPSCRHRQMLPYFLAADAIDQPMYFDYDGDHSWYHLSGTGEDEALADACNNALPEGVIPEGMTELADLEQIAGADTLMAFAKELDNIDGGDALAEIEAAKVLGDVGEPSVEALEEAYGTTGNLPPEPPVEVERVAAPEPHTTPLPANEFKRRF